MQHSHWLKRWYLFCALSVGLSLLTWAGMSFLAFGSQPSGVVALTPIPVPHSRACQEVALPANASPSEDLHEISNERK